MRRSLAPLQSIARSGRPLGHNHLDDQAYDPGPAFDWEVPRAVVRSVKGQ